ncbi:ankyrin-1-like [Lineus longissimus]|uniref:ankyrin-1-like n=1 Tax=Lineus longissimus TaxID=88925 RepID=UPI00315D237A
MESDHRRWYLNDALSYAVDTSNIDSVKELISVGADVNHLCNDRGHVLAFDAIQNHGTDILKVLLEAGTSVDVIGETGGHDYETLLCLASALGFVDIVELLLRFHADVNGATDTSALHKASINGHLDVAKILIENNANIEFLDCFRRTPLYCAFSCKSVKVARLLIAHGADVNFEYNSNAFLNTNTQKLLTVASDANSTELVDLLLENGYPVSIWTESDEDSEMDTETDLTDEDDEWREDNGQVGEGTRSCGDRNLHNLYMYFDAKWDVTRHFMLKDIHFCPVPRLHKIFLKGDMNEINALFDDPSIHASDIRRLDRTRKSVFHYAFANGEPEVVEKCILLASRFGVKSYGFKPLFFAAKHGYVEIVECLVKLGLPLHKGDSSTQETPLHIACCNGHNSVIKKLVEYGADVNALNNDGYNSLSLVTENGNVSMVRFLLQHGAKVIPDNIIGWSGWTVLHKAANLKHKNNVEVMEVLLAHSPRLVNVPGKYQRDTPLHVTCFNGVAGVAECLIRHGADIGALDYRGNTSLHLACTNRHPDIVSLLIQQGAELNIGNVDGLTPLVCAVDRFCEYPVELDVSRIVMTLLDNGGSLFSSSGPKKLTCHFDMLYSLYVKNVFIFVTFMQLSAGVMGNLKVNVSNMLNHNDLDSVHLVQNCGHQLYLSPDVLSNPDFVEKFNAIQNSPLSLNSMCIHSIRRLLRRHKGSLVKLISVLPVAPGLKTMLTFPDSLHACDMAPVAKLLYYMCSISL